MSNDKSDPVGAYASKEHFVAKAIDGDTETQGGPSVFGYSVEGDLARNYVPSELFFLCLTGRPPTRAEGQLFARIVTVLAPSPVGETATHAGILARIAGASDAHVFMVAAMGAAEAARSFFEDPSPQPARVDRLAALLEEGGTPPPWPPEAGFADAIRACLVQLGLSDTWQQQWVVALARLLTVPAELGSWSAGALDEYPLRRPAYVYEEKRDEP